MKLHGADMWISKHKTYLKHIFRISRRRRFERGGRINLIWAMKMSIFVCDIPICLRGFLYVDFATSRGCRGYKVRSTDRIRAIKKRDISKRAEAEIVSCCILHFSFSRNRMCFYPLFCVAVHHSCLKLKCAAGLIQFILNVNTEMRKRNGHPGDDLFKYAWSSFAFTTNLGKWRIWVLLRHINNTTGP